MGSRNNQFGANWWAKRWNLALERMGLSNRLQRGRTYARAGNVLNIKVEKGVVEALVRGSGPKPYRVRIEAPVLSDEQWSRILENLASKAIFSARLLSSEMPENIEDAFIEAGTTLFPEDIIAASCSCPDIANPCKHIASVHYILGQEFDADPFFILEFRGRTKEEIIGALRKARGKKLGSEDFRRILENSNEVKSELSMEQEDSIEDIMAQMKEYEELDERIKSMSFSYTPPSVPYSIIKMLGTPAHFVNKTRFTSGVEGIYNATSDKIKKLVNK